MVILGLAIKLSSIWLPQAPRSLSNGFKRFLVARVLGSMAAGALFSSLTLSLFGRGSSALGVAMAIIALALPGIAAFRLIGSFADGGRWGVGLAVGTGLQLAGLTLLALTFMVPWQMYAALLLVGLGQSLLGVVMMAFLAATVDDSKLTFALSRQRVVLLLGRSLGAFIGALFVRNVDGGFFVRPVVGVAALLTLSYVMGVWSGMRRWRAVPGGRVSRPSDGRSQRSFLSEIKSTGVLTLTLTSVIVALVVEGVAPLEVFMVRGELGGGAMAYAVMTWIGGSGLLLGSWLAGTRLVRWSRRSMILSSYAVVGVMLLVQAGVGLIGAYMSAGFVAAGLFGFSSVLFEAELISRSGKERRGSVFAGVTALLRSSALIAMGVSGLLSDVTGPRIVYAVCGLLCVMAAAVVLRSATRGVKGGPPAVEGSFPAR